MNAVDHSLWKIVFGFMAIVAGLIFVGALAMSDADIFNLETARAQAAQINSRTSYEAQRGQMDLAVYPQLAWERSQAQIRQIRAQAASDEAAVAEAIRVRKADNDRMLAARSRFDLAKIWFALLAAVGVLVVALYGLLLFVQRTLDRALPPRRKVALTADDLRQASHDPWDSPAFRSYMRQQARRNEAALRAAENAMRQRASGQAPVGRPANGNGTHANGNGAQGETPPRPPRERRAMP